MGEADPESAFLGAVDECLDAVEDAGGLPPLIVAAVAVNGVWVPLAQHIEGGRSAFPANVLVTDARGKAVLFRVELDGKPLRMN